MRRILVLVAALGAMWFLGGLEQAPDAGLLHPLTLAAIGFVVLAAFTVGEMGSSIGLPKVTGYIVAGVLVGPQAGKLLFGDGASGILSEAVVDNLTVFNQLALGLIAMTAGLELDLKAIARVWKSLTSIVLLKIPLLLVLVGGAFIGIETFAPSLGLPPIAIVPVALIVAVLGIGTSPAIAIAVVNDSGSKGRLTDLLLAIAVVKDLVVVISLALALAIDKTLLMPGVTLDAQVLIHVAEELGSSILVGALLGVLLTAYVRYVNKQMLLFVLLTILVAAEISAVYHLELLLVFIAAGFLVRNFTPYEHELLHPLERIALPVFVVFFTTAGAEVDLITTWSILPLALALFSVRVFAYYIAGRLGSAIGGESKAIQDNAWLTFLPQAGVTLGLVGLAANALPELSDQISAIGLALVTLNLLVGPVTMGLGLKWAGETKGSTVGDEAEFEEEPLPRELTEDTSEGMYDGPVRTPSALVAPLGGGELTGILQDLAKRLNEDIEVFFEDVAAPAAIAVRDAALSRVSVANDVESLVSSALKPMLMPKDGWDGHVMALYQQMAGKVQALPKRASLISIDTPPHHTSRAAEAGTLGGLRRTAAQLLALPDRRNPALRMHARCAIEGRLAAGVHELFNSWYRNQAHVLELLLRAIEHDEDSQICRERVAQATHVWLRREQEALRRVVAEGIAWVVADLLEYASPLGYPSRPRFSRVEPQIELNLDSIANDVELWRDAVVATSEHVQAATLVAVGDARTRAVLTDWGESALDDVRADAIPRIEETITALEVLHERLGTDEANVDWEMEVKRAFPVSRRLALRADGATFRQRTQPQALQNVMSPLVESAPSRLRAVGVRRASRLDHPRELLTKTIPMAQRLRAILLDELVPECGRALAPLKSRITGLHRNIAEGVEVASFGVAEVVRSPAEPHDLHGPIRRAIVRLKAERDDLIAAIEQARMRLRGEEDDTRNALDALLDVRGVGVDLVQTSVAATRRSIRSWLVGLRSFVASAGQRARSVQAEILDHPWITDRAVRLGHAAVDGDAMRHAVYESLPSRELSAGVLNLFASRAVDDRRLFVAHKPALERLGLLLSRPDDHARLAALVVGRRGSGRTSLLNMLQLRARERQVIRVDDASHDRTMGLIGVLATEMHTAPNEEEVLEALGRIRPLVLVDNLGRFLAPTFESTQRLDCVLGLVAASSAGGAEWVVTIEASLLHRLEDVLSVTRVFNQRVDLGPVDWRDLREVMRARFRLGGLTCRHDYLSRIEAILPGEPEERYFKRLAEASGGNLSSAMPAQSGALVSTEEEAVFSMSSPHAVTLPFVGDLSPVSRATLAVLYSYGPMTRSQLAHGLGLDQGALFRHLQALHESGLLSDVHDETALITIPAGLLASVRTEMVLHRQITDEGVR
jgi:Kef-type K+ transport system membrane component KefB